MSVRRRSATDLQRLVQRVWRTSGQLYRLCDVFPGPLNSTAVVVSQFDARWQRVSITMSHINTLTLVQQGNSHGVYLTGAVVM